MPLEESFSIEMGVPGGVSPVGIMIMVWKSYAPKLMDKATIEHNRIANLDLKSFSKNLSKIS